MADRRQRVDDATLGLAGEHVRPLAGKRRQVARRKLNPVELGLLPWAADE